MQQWIMENWLQAATLATLMIGVVKVIRWTGIIDTRMNNFEGWMQNHIDHHPGKSK